MQLHRTTLAVPGDSLADISSDLANADAGDLLATWTALWDPALIAQTREIPAAKAVDSIVSDPRDPGELVLVPQVSRGEPIDDWLPEDPLVLCLPRFASRREVIAVLSQRFELDQPLGTPAAADFFALGYAFLQVELLTRSMHYDPLVKQESLRAAIVAAADAANASNEQALATHLADAYDHLMQSRNHYYPIDFYLVDLMLTAPSVAGRPLAAACREATSANVLVTGEFVQHLADEHLDSLAALREAWDNKNIAVCGGSLTEQPLSGLTPEGLLRELRDGIQRCELHLGRRPTVFAHTGGPMAPLVPGVLHKLGYHAAVLANFCGAPLPPSSGSRTTWTGLDNTPIEALATAPIDTGSHAAMLGLSQKIQRAMNYDLAASLLLAGWPGHRTEWHADLVQVTRRSSLLGRPVTLDEYFDITTSHDYSGTTSAEVYAASTSASPDDESRATKSLAALAKLAGADAERTADAGGAEALASLLGPQGSAPAAGRVWLNASSLPRERLGGTLPAFGWRWEPPADPADRPPRCETGVLRGEQLQVVFDEVTGGISATRLHTARGNHLSQQLVLRPIGPQGIGAGMQLALDGWEVVESSDTCGTLATNYRVVDRDAKTLANIRQLTSLVEQARQIDVCVDFQPLDERAGACEVISRIAVRDEDFAITRGLQGIDLPTSASQVACQWLGINVSHLPLAVLCDLPRVHRRHTGRMLDTTLVPQGGKATAANLSYVLDCRYPAQAFQVWGEPRLITSVPAGPTHQASGWWLHVGARNLMVTNVSAESLDHDVIVRMRLLETAGRPANTSLAAWKPIAEARMLNFLGEPDQLLSVSDGVVQLSMAPYEFAEVEFVLGGGQ